MMITVIGRGHSGTRAISRTLLESGVYMGAQLNDSSDLVPPEELYEACRVMARKVRHLGGLEWDFSALHQGPIDSQFTKLVESYLQSVLSNSSRSHQGWKLPETTLVYPWIVRMFPDIRYIHWYRDPRDGILGGHKTDDLADFGVPYDRTEDRLLRRAISWFYQWKIVKETPAPRHVISIRFEDFIQRQEDTLKRLEEFVGFPLVPIPVEEAPVGRWKNDPKHRDFDFLAAPLKELGYR